MQSANSTQRSSHSLAFLLILIAAIATFSLYELIENYGTGFGELDSYRVFAGVLDAFGKGEPLSGPLVYGYGISRGYFALVALLHDAVQQPRQLARALNLVTFVSYVVALVAFCGLCWRVGGRAAAAAGAVVLGIVPIWLDGGQYAHPMWPAMAFMLVALAAAAWRDAGSIAVRWVCDGIAVVALGLAFGMRLDVVLMAPMFLGLCVADGRYAWSRAAVLVGIGLLGLCLLGAIITVTPRAAASQDSAFAMLRAWHNPSRFVRYFGVAQIRVLRAVNPALLIAFFCAIVVAWRRRLRAVLLLVLPTVVLNYLFWIPNPQPERHFLYLVPPFALAIAALVSSIATETSQRSRSFGSRNAPEIALVLAIVFAVIGGVLGKVWPLYLAGVPIAVVALEALASELQPEPTGLRRFGPALAGLVLCGLIVVTPSRLMFHNPFSTGEGEVQARDAGSLLDLPHLDKPVVVIGGAYPLIAAMLARDPQGVVWSVDIPWLNATTKTNTFHMFIQSWLEDEAVAATTEISKHDPAFLYVDPTIAPGVQNRLRTVGTLDLLKQP